MTYDMYTHYRFMIASACVLGFSDAPIRQDGASPVFRQEYCERKLAYLVSPVYSEQDNFL